MAATVETETKAIVHIEGDALSTDDEFTKTILATLNAADVSAAAPSGYYPGLEARMAAGLVELLGGKIVSVDPADDDSIEDDDDEIVY